MGGGGKFRRTGGGGKRKRKQSKYSGKALNDDLRETLGGVSAEFNTKPTDELFEVDAGPAPTNNRERVLRAKKSSLSRKRRRVEGNLKELEKIDAKTATKANAVSLLLQKDLRVKSTYEQKKLREMIKETSKAVSTSGAVKNPKKKAVVAVRDAKQVRKTTSELSDVTKVYDIWGAPKPHPVERVGTVDKKFKPVKTLHPGCSFNPSEEDHLDSLRKAVVKEKEQQEAELQHKSFYKISRELRKEAELEKLKTGETMPIEDDVGEDGNSSAEALSEDDEEILNDATEATSLSVNKPVRCKRKSRTQRNKQKKVMREKIQAEQRKKERQVKNQLQMIKSTSKRVKEQEKLEEEEKEKLNKLLQEKEEKREPVIKVRGRPVTRNKLNSVEAVLPSDVSQTMRKIAPHGNLLKDRFEYMQARNLFEVGHTWGQSKKAKSRTLERGSKFIDDGPPKPTPKGTNRKNKAKKLPLTIM